MGHRHHHKSLGATWSMYINMASDGSTEHGQLHGFQGQHRPQTSTWSLVAIKPIDINMVFSTEQTTDLCKALNGHMGHGHQHAPKLQQDPGHICGSQQQYIPRISTWPQVAAQATRICMTPSITGHGQQQGPSCVEPWYI